MNASRRMIGSYTRDIIRESASHIRGETLDLGAGTAKYKEEILRHASRYVSTDYVAGTNIDIVCDAHVLPFADGSFDTIICTQVLEHVARPWIVLQEMARILRVGGRCIITVPFMMPSHSDPYDFFRYTPDGAASLCEQAGLLVVDKAKYGGKWVVLAETFKFAFCNPYVHKKPSFLRRNLFRFVYGLLLKIEKGTRQDAIVYADTYIVAQKSQ